MTEPSSGSNKPKRPVVVPAIALVAATALGITALLGGLEDAPAKKPQALKVGELLDQGQFDTKVIESKVVLEKAATKFDEDKRFLELRFSVTNKGGRTTTVGALPDGKTSGYGFAGTIRKMTPALKGGQFGPDVAVHSKGEKTSGQLQPGIASIVVVRYELDLTSPPPEQISLDFARLEEQESPMTETTGWTQEQSVTVTPNPLSLEGLKAPLTGSGRPQMRRTPRVVATISLPVKQEAE